MAKLSLNRVIYVSAAILGFFVMVSIAGLIYLDTDSGRRQLTNLINENLRSPESTIEISDIDGSLFSDIIIPSIVFSDLDGKWLEINNTQVKWSTASLLQKRFLASNINISSAHLIRLPNTAEPRDQAANEPFTLPSLPIDINIAQYEISAINIDKNVANIPSVFKLDGTLKLTQNDGIKVKTNLISTEGHNDNIKVDITYPRDGSNLDTVVNINAPENGFFATLAGLDLRGGLAINLDGHGPLNDWSGTFNVQKNEKVITDASITRIHETLSVDAPVDLSDLLSNDLSALIGSSNHFKLKISPSDDNQSSDLNMTLSSEYIDLKTDGEISFSDLNENNHLNFLIDIKDSDPFNPITEPLYFKPFVVTGVLTNLFSTPQISVNYEDIEAGATDQVEASFNGRIDATLSQQIIAVGASGNISKISGPAINNVSPLLEGGIDWSLDTNVSDQYSNVKISNLSIESSFFKSNGSGELNTETGALKAKLDGVVDDISEIATALDLNQALAGRAVLGADIERNNDQEPIRTSLNLVTESINLGNEALNEIIGSSPTFTANVSQSAKGEINIDKTAITGDFLTFDFGGNISPDKKINNTDFKLSLSDTQNLKSFGGTALNGNIDLVGVVTGELASPSLEIRTGFNQLNIQNFELSNFKTHITASNVLNELTGVLEIKSDTNFGELSATSSFQKIAAIFKITETNISLGRYQATGDFIVPPNSPITGTLSLITNDITNNDTDLEGQITANVDLTDKNNDQRIIVESAFEEINFPLSTTELLSLKSGTISGDILLNDTSPEITLTATLKELSHPEIQAQEANLKVEQIDKGFTYTIDALGTNSRPYQLGIAGDFLSENEDRKITFDLNGSIADVPIKITDTALVTLHKDDISIAPFILEIGDGQFSGNLEKSENGTVAYLAANNADLTPISVLIDDIPITGLLNGELNLKASAEALLSDFNVTLSNLTLRNSETSIEDNLELNVIGKVTEKNVELSGGLAADEFFNATFTAGLPIDINPVSFTTNLPESTPINGNIIWAGNIEPLWPILQLTNHDLNGNLDAKLQIGGTIAAPDIDGNIIMNEGRYENMQTGFVANNIDMDANIKDRRLTLNRFNANDGEEGLISATADINLKSDFNYDALVNLTLSNTKLVRQSELEIMASSELTFEKNNERTSLVGEVTVDNAEIGAIEQGGPAIAKLDVIEINGEGIVSEQQSQNDNLGPIDLDLKFIVPGKLFIRSFGLDSEWEADLEVEGTSEKPIVSGAASLIRGFFEFSGKRFNLTRGNFSFPGDQTNDPIIEIAAEHQLSDMIANLRIYGQASNPKLEMSSSPYLPENEVLARILFGTSVAELTAVEAVQLASAVHSLSNGGGQGLLGGIRRAIGVDRLSIDNDASREYGTTITGGKYLTDNVYVEVSTAPATGETATSVEVGLTRNLSLVTRRTLDHDNNLSIRWFWDY